MRAMSIHGLRRAALLLAAALLLPPAFRGYADLSNASAAEDAAPRRSRPAEVLGKRVYARSGPGLHFYPCSTLREGMRVTVVDEAEDGWVAVEPPASAFCWISGTSVRWVDDEVVEVVRDKSVVRVGTAFSDARDVIQTYLPQGARARVLRNAEGAPGVDEWLRIHPPAGEVRWVPIEELTLLSPEAAAPPPVAEPQPAAPIAAVAQVAPTSIEAAEVASAEASPAAPATDVVPPKEPPPGWSPTKRRKAFSWMEDPAVRMALMEAPLPGPGEGNSPPPRPASPASTSPPMPSAPPQANPNTPAPFPGAAAAEPAPRPENADPNLLWEQRDELLAIQEALVRMTALPPTTWELEPLETRVRGLIDAAETALVRGEARALAKQMAKLSDLRQGYRQLDAGRLPKDREARLLEEIEVARTPKLRAVAGGSPSPAAPTAAKAVSAPPSVAAKERPITPVSENRGETPMPMSNASAVTPMDVPSPPPVPAARPRYDAEGRLAENLEALPGQSRYVLRDESGRNVAFLTPSPGVNLRRQLGKRVGVVGTRQGQDPGRAPHVQVRHLDELPAPPITAAAPASVGR